MIIQRYLTCEENMSINKDTISFTLVNSLSELDTLTVQLKVAAEKWRLPQKTVLQLNLILDELFTNIVKYGYKDELAHIITISLDKKGSTLLVTMIDDGGFFDMTQQATPILNEPLADKDLGGLGIFLARQYADKVIYERQDNKNIVTFTKVIE
jgi:anti-sigma regulatory factor (Ser/Thr protein kinase)